MCWFRWAPPGVGICCSLLAVRAQLVPFWFYEARWDACRCDLVLCKWRLLIGWFSLCALLWRKLLSKKLTLSGCLNWETQHQHWVESQCFSAQFGLFIHTSLQLSAPGTSVQGELYQIKAALISYCTFHTWNATQSVVAEVVWGRKTQEKRSQQWGVSPWRLLDVMDGLVSQTLLALLSNWSLL